MPQTDSTYQLLALCARAEGHPTFYEQLAEQLRVFEAWDELPVQAEIHGMGPLLWHHIRQSGVAIPEETRRTLQGLTLRHRLHNQINARVLTEIIALLQGAGIQPLVLKGLALAYQYYPDPALRPGSDIDLLFKQDDVLPALDLLASAGFHIGPPHIFPELIPKELTADSPPRNGISVRVELHHYDPKGRHEKGNSPDPEFEKLDAPPEAFSINDCIVHTPTYMEMLHYLMRHIVKHLFVSHAGNPVQIKWMADIISLVEHHAEEIDWTGLKQHHPELLNRLELFYSYTPLPERLANVIPIKQVLPPRGLNQYPPGWPHQSIKQWKQTGLLKFIWQILIPPSDWWLRLYYGLGEGSLFWHRHIVYRAEVLSSIFWVSTRGRTIIH
jgi:hypothetical protein